MDIDILLALQYFRNNIGAPLVDFFSKMTFLGELNSAIVIMAVVYWCCSKSFGSYLLMGWSGNRLDSGKAVCRFHDGRPAPEKNHPLRGGNARLLCDQPVCRSAHQNLDPRCGGFSDFLLHPDVLRHLYSPLVY